MAVATVGPGRHSILAPSTVFVPGGRFRMGSLKGFRSYKQDGYGLLERKYIKWNDIEVSADDTVERIIAHTTRITETRANASRI